MNTVGVDTMLTTALDEGKLSASHPGCFVPTEKAVDWDTELVRSVCR